MIQRSYASQKVLEFYKELPFNLRERNRACADSAGGWPSNGGEAGMGRAGIGRAVRGDVLRILN